MSGMLAPLLLLLLAAPPATGAAAGAVPDQAATPPASAGEILARVDAQANRGRDATITLTLSATDARGQKTERELTIWQKGEDRRMLKVLAPARLRGVGLLVPEPGQLLLYLPAFGRVRQLVGPDRDDRFLGTDFTFDDLTRTSFSRDYSPVLEQSDDREWVLRLTPRQPGQARHAALRLWVRRADGLYRQVEFLDASGKATRRITLDDFRDEGPRPIAHRITVEDLAGGQRSEARISAARFDQGLDDELFSRRYLERPPPAR